MHEFFGIDWTEWAALMGIVGAFITIVSAIVGFVFKYVIVAPFAGKVDSLTKSMDDLNSSMKNSDKRLTVFEKRLDDHDRRLDRHHEQIKYLKEKR
ncbi:hypothetical protein FC19_GL001428 [Liquorilactobacillus aquaticus DSM 21051]|uniref:Uncharacterized protein n=2 Tax=Liquorilactobacillus TaxID=2767888 RepID=A0A0R2D6S3_9LACO|nr:MULTISPECIES: hypothetical protein [Liquorilactobacillus]KRL36631.1 hypothetical protein FD20_GL001175 [Liquorilactobacillus uvarum DSM 19971]KRM95948.1 hypothetical protein FC19_GL001428 [Liquorilactobacillus aquaticus DSM 21051]